MKIIFVLLLDGKGLSAQLNMQRTSYMPIVCHLLCYGQIRYCAFVGDRFGM